MPLIISDVIDDKEFVEHGDEIEINLESGLVVNKSKKKEKQAKGLSKVQMDIYQSGNLFEYAKTL